MPTKQPDELDEAILAFLGERHRHKCPSKCGTGCHNCRYTGMEQMPCSICDKDGIAFKRRNEFKQRLVALQERAVRKALNKLEAQKVRADDCTGDTYVVKVKRILELQPKGDTEDE